MASTVPLGRLATPHEVAVWAAALCSPYAGYITGETLTIDGGHWLEQRATCPLLAELAEVRLDAALEEAAGDDEALDLARAPDAVDPHLAVEARHRVLQHVAAAAEHLEGAVDDAAGGLGGVELCHRDLAVDDAPVGLHVEGLGGVIREEASGEGSVEVGQLERDALVLGDLRAEGLALQGEVACQRQRARRRATAARGDEQPLDEEPLARASPPPSGMRFSSGTRQFIEDDLWMVVEVRVVEKPGVLAMSRPGRQGSLKKSACSPSATASTR